MFTGTPEKVINLFNFISREVQEILNNLGYSSLDQIIGKTELLKRITSKNILYNQIDLTSILTKIDSKIGNYDRKIRTRNEVSDNLDKKIIKDMNNFIKKKQKIKLKYSIKNTDRSVGSRLSSLITKKYGMNYFKDNYAVIEFSGSAGQSFGAFVAKGITLKVLGEANDYLGKGLCGGKIIVCPPAQNLRQTNENIIIGNVALYGATNGYLYAAGQAGDRFAVRNSGANAIIEGCGDNGCEYMTNGIIVILGNVGNNFAAGMTDGIILVYDYKNTLSKKINDETIIIQNDINKYLEKILKDMIKKHCKLTNSNYAKKILKNWDQELTYFYKVFPKKMIEKSNTVSSKIYYLN